MDLIRRFGILVFVLVIALSIPFIFAAYPANFIFNYLKPLDPNGIFSLRTIIHRIVQFILVIILLKLYFKKPYSELGFNLQNIKLSKSIITWIVIIWPILIVLLFFIAVHAIDGFRESLLSLFPPGTKKIYSLVGQDVLMLNAFAEEPLYRSFVILALYKYRDNKIAIFNIKVSHAVIISSFIFMFAHISFTIFPFQITFIDPMQLAMTLCTGLILGIAFERTRSLLAPVILHSYINVIISLTGYLTSILIR